MGRAHSSRPRDRREGLTEWGLRESEEAPFTSGGGSADLPSGLLVSRPGAAWVPTSSGGAAGFCVGAAQAHSPSQRPQDPGVRLGA